jgi:hypothetical protein
MTINHEDRGKQSNKCNNHHWEKKLSVLTLLVQFQQMEKFSIKSQIESVELENLRLVENCLEFRKYQEGVE